MRIVILLDFDVTTYPNPDGADDILDMVAGDMASYLHDLRVDGCVIVNDASRLAEHPEFLQELFGESAS